MIMLLSKLYAFYGEKGHAIMDCPFVPFHIKEGIIKHVELQNVAGIIIDQPQEQESRIHVIQNRFKGMELGSQLGPQSRQIRLSIQTKSKKPEGYSHSHTTSQWIPMMTQP